MFWVNDLHSISQSIGLDTDLWPVYLFTTTLENSTLKMKNSFQYKHIIIIFLRKTYIYMYIDAPAQISHLTKLFQIFFY